MSPLPPIGLLLGMLLVSACGGLTNRYDANVLRCGADAPREGALIAVRDAAGNRLSGAEIEAYLGIEGPAVTVTEQGCVASSESLVVRSKTVNIAATLADPQATDLQLAPYSGSFPVWRACGDWPRPLAIDEPVTYYRATMATVAHGGLHLVATMTRRGITGEPTALAISDRGCIAVPSAWTGALSARDVASGAVSLVAIERPTTAETLVRLPLAGGFDLALLDACGTVAFDAASGVRAVKLVDPELAELGPSDHLEAFAFADDATDPESLPTTPRGCALIPAARADGTFVARIIRNDRLLEATARFAAIGANQVLRLAHVAGPVFAPSCPATGTLQTQAHTLALPLIAAAGLSDARVAAQLSDTLGQVVGQSASATDALSLHGLADGPYTLKVAVTRLAAWGRPDATAESLCAIIIDHAAPVASPRLMTTRLLGGRVVFVRAPGEAISFDVADTDGNGASYFYCLSESDQDTGCTYAPLTGTVQAPSGGRWTLFAYGADAAKNRSAVQSATFYVYHATELELVKNLAARSALELSRGRQLEAMRLAIDAENRRKALPLAEEQDEVARVTLQALMDAAANTREIARTPAFDTMMTVYRWSRDGKFLAFRNWDSANPFQLFDVAHHRVVTLGDEPQFLNDVSEFSYDGRLIVAEYWNQSLNYTDKRILDVEGHLVKILPGSDTFGDVLFTPDPDVVYLQDNDRGRLYRISNGAESTLLAPVVPPDDGNDDTNDDRPDLYVRKGFAVHPSKPLFATASSKRVEVWTMAGVRVAQFDAGNPWFMPHSVQFTGRGDEIAIIHGDKIDLRSLDGVLGPVLAGPYDYSDYSVMTAYGGQLLTRAKDQKSVTLFDEASAKVRDFATNGPAVESYGFADNGALIGLGFGDNADATFELRTAANAKVLKVPYRSLLYTGATRVDDRLVVGYGHEASVWRLDAMPFNETTDRRGVTAPNLAIRIGEADLIAGLSGTEVVIWNWEGVEQQRCLGGTARVLRVAQWARRLVAATLAGVEIWDEDCTNRRDLVTDANVWNVTAMPNGAGLVVRTKDSTRIYLDEGAPALTIPYYGDLGFAANASRLAVSGRDAGDVGIYDIVGGTVQLVRTFAGFAVGTDNHLNTVGLSPDGQILATGERDGAIKFWNIASGEMTGKGSHTWQIEGLEFSPDGTLVLSSAEDRWVKVWRTDGTLMRAVRGGTPRADGDYDAHFDRAGTRFAAIEPEGRLSVWDVATGERLVTVEAGKGDSRTRHFAFHPEGLRLVTWGDGRTRFFPLAAGAIWQRSCQWITPYLANDPRLTDDERKVCDAR